GVCSATAVGARVTAAVRIPIADRSVSPRSPLAALIGGWARWSGPEHGGHFPVVGVGGGLGGEATLFRVSRGVDPVLLRGRRPPAVAGVAGTGVLVAVCTALV